MPFRTRFAPSASDHVTRFSTFTAAFGAAAALALLAGCATTPDGATGDINTPEYRTGSNIPVKDRTTRADAKAYDAQSVQDAMRGGVPGLPAGVRP